MFLDSWNEEKLLDWFRQTQPFSELPVDAWEVILRAGLVCSFQPGELLFAQGVKQPFLWAVLDGEVRLFDSLEFRVEVPRFSGQLFGLKSLLDNSELSLHCAVASAVSTCLRIPARVFFELQESFESFSTFFQKNFTENPNVLELPQWVGGDKQGPYATMLRSEAPFSKGTVLGVGTNSASFCELLYQSTEKLVIAAQKEEDIEALNSSCSEDLQEHVRFVSGNWQDDSFFEGESFDVVLIDRLLGSLEQTAPYSQSSFFSRMRRHTESRLYIIGLEPPILSEGEPHLHKIVQDIYQIYGVCLLLMGEQPHREFPLNWVLQNLERSHFKVEGWREFERFMDLRFVHKILNTCLLMLPQIQHSQLVLGLARSIREIRERAMGEESFKWGFRYGKDYLVLASPIPE